MGAGSNWIKNVNVFDPLMGALVPKHHHFAQAKWFFIKTKKSLMRALCFFCFYEKAPLRGAWCL
jgi:hypothetical protein